MSDFALEREITTKLRLLIIRQKRALAEMDEEEDYLHKESVQTRLHFFEEAMRAMEGAVQA
jgi:hypothetical protein